MSEKKEVVNVRLDSTSKTLLEEKAAAAGQTVADYLRKLINDAQAQNKPPEGATVVTLHPTVIEALAGVLSTVVSESLPQYFELSTPVQASPEREYLRKLEGLEPESENTLTVEQEESLQALRNEVVETTTNRLLLQHYSVAIGFDTLNVVQQNMLKNMLEKRELSATENLPTLTAVFKNAIWKALETDSIALWNKHLFKATYGFEHKEFEAVFGL